ncbi:hypothetical protein EVAR_28946_1 [Eumeta japonica]|uniref:Uncharacterized protein n=1 Tax=Eumeta variegata TaxID=151549 RepID=A0A4C1VY83_EUMVA|nr:hypothetical protein EVAR_28946_1 [Eumeta japonica]
MTVDRLEKLQKQRTGYSEQCAGVRSFENKQKRQQHDPNDALIVILVNNRGMSICHPKLGFGLRACPAVWTSHYTSTAGVGIHTRFPRRTVPGHLQPTFDPDQVVNPPSSGRPTLPRPICGRRSSTFHLQLISSTSDVTCPLPFKLNNSVRHVGRSGCSTDVDAFVKYEN